MTSNIDPTRLNRADLKAAVSKLPGWNEYRKAQGFTASTATRGQLEDAYRHLAQGMPAEAPAQEDEDQGQEAQAPTQEDQDEDQEAPAKADPLQDVRPFLAPAVVEKLETWAAAQVADLDAERKARAQAEAQAKAAQARAKAQAPDGTPAADFAGLPVPAKVGTVTGRKALGASGKAGKIELPLYDGTMTPAEDPDFQFPQDVLDACVTAMARRDARSGLGRHVWLYGPKGTGKTSLPEQIAARLGRAYFVVSFDERTEALDLFGGKGLKDGNTVSQPGILAQALQVPGAIILLDEPTLGRPGCHAALHDLLQNGRVTLKETGETFYCAEDVSFFAADNSQGQGDELGGYEGVAPVNAAFLDRFSRFIEMTWLDAEAEAAMIAARAQVPVALGRQLVAFAQVTRTEADQGGSISAGLTPRRLVALAEALDDGLNMTQAFEMAVCSASAPEDREALRTLRNAHLSAADLGRALKGEDPTLDAATQAQGQEAQGQEAQAQGQGQEATDYLRRPSQGQDAARGEFS